ARQKALQSFRRGRHDGSRLVRCASACGSRYMGGGRPFQPIDATSRGSPCRFGATFTARRKRRIVAPPASRARHKNQTTGGSMLGLRRGAIAALCIVAVAWVHAPARAAEGWRPDPALVEAARKEGEVLFYTTHIVEQIVRPLIKGFQ